MINQEIVETPSGLYHYALQCMSERCIVVMKKVAIFPLLTYDSTSIYWLTEHPSLERSD